MTAAQDSVGIDHYRRDRFLDVLIVGFTHQKAPHDIMLFILIVLCHAVCIMTSIVCRVMLSF